VVSWDKKREQPSRVLQGNSMGLGGVTTEGTVGESGTKSTISRCFGRGRDGTWTESPIHTQVFQKIKA